jgi:hypothetical protein
MQYAFSYHFKNAKNRTLVLLSSQEHLQSYRNRFTDSGRHICSTYALEAISKEDYQKQYPDDSTLISFDSLGGTQGILLNITYPWGGDFVSKIRPILEHDLGLISQNDPACEGSDGYGIYFYQDEEMMHHMMYWKEMSDQVKIMTDWEWYDNNWGTISDAIRQSNALMELSTDWKHFEIDLHFLEPIGFSLEQIENIVLQNNNKLPFSEPIIGFFTSHTLPFKRGEVWQGMQLRLSPIEDS